MGDATLYKPLYLVEKLVDEIGTSITYVYEDLVFVEHSDVLLMFDQDDNECLHLFVHEDVETGLVEKICAVWMQAAEQHNVQLVYSGPFAMEPIPGKEELSIRFG